MATHRRIKFCCLCSTKYEYIWEDSENWVERIICKLCRKKVGDIY